MNHPTKADRLAAERILKKAVQQAIARLRTSSGSPTRAELLDINARSFGTAIDAADMLLAAPIKPTQEEETAAC